VPKRLSRGTNLKKELFTRAVGVVTVFRTDENEAKFNWTPNGPLFMMAGAASYAERKIMINWADSEGGQAEHIQAEDDIGDCLDWTTTAALRDKMLQIFPSAVIVYILERRKGGIQVVSNWNGSSLACQSLISWAGFNLRQSKEAFGPPDANDPMADDPHNYPIDILELRAEPRGYLKLFASVQPLEISGYAEVLADKSANFIEETQRPDS